MTSEMLYKIVAQLFERYGFELVDGTCTIKEQEKEFIITINEDSSYSEEFIDMMDDLEEYLYEEEELEILRSKCTFNQYEISVKKY